MPRNAVALRIGWICLSVVGASILGFGVGAACFSSEPLARADGVALTGMGLFGILVTLVPFRRRERWAWFALCFYPVFWLAHLAGLIVPAKAFWGAGVAGARQPVAN